MAFAQFYLETNFYWLLLRSRFSRLGYGVAGILEVPGLVQHCVNLHPVDVEKLNDEIVGVLVALGSRIRVLGIENQADRSIAPWRKSEPSIHGPRSGSFETTHCSSAKAIDLLSLMRTKVVSLSLYILSTVYVRLLDPPNDMQTVGGRGKEWYGFPRIIRHLLYFLELAVCPFLQIERIQVSGLRPDGASRLNLKIPIQ